jgi:FAD/FMN-containing dehydrogenase
LKGVSISDQAVSIPQLRDALDGRVIAPGDEGYDEGRAGFYGGDRRPAAIARVADTEDVARVISLTRERGMQLAVRSGGHSMALHSTTDGGIVLDLRDLNALEIDVAGRTAWAGTGLTTGEYTEAAGEHGLATGFGDTGTVGLGGLTLGGGVGFLSRKYGLTIDSLLAADVVTADAELLRADAESHPDLFWGIRGGGGNFGVATRLHFRLHEVDRAYGGMLMLPATPEVIAGFVAEAEAAPEELSGIGNVFRAPPMPFVPPEHHGKLVVMGLIVYAGPAEDGERALEPFRSLATPVADLVKPMRYPEIFQFTEGGPHPTAFAARNMFIDSLDGGAGETIVSHLDASTATMAVSQIRVLGGAVSRVPSDATAYAHRSRRIMVNLAAVYEDPTEASTHEAWVTDFTSALRGDQRGAYSNFVGDEGEGRVREAYPGATWDRLAELKGRYDPTNLFRLNQNIPPAAA